MPVVSILSGKGGVGKTTTSSNIATALVSEFGRKVIVLDTNVSASHIRLHFGMYDGIKKTLPDVMMNSSNIANAIYLNKYTGVDVMPSPTGLIEETNLGNLKNIIWELAKSDYDFLIIDASPGFGNDVINAIKVADIVLVVTTPSIPDVSDALKAVDLVKNYNKKVYVVLNRVTNKGYEIDADNIEKILGSRIVSIILYDEKVSESISSGVPVVAYSGGAKSSIALKKLAGFLVGKKYIPTWKERIKWAFGF